MKQIYSIGEKYIIIVRIRDGVKPQTYTGKIINVSDYDILINTIKNEEVVIGRDRIITARKLEGDYND
jgi:hypothetical protein